MSTYKRRLILSGLIIGTSSVVAAQSRAVASGEDQTLREAALTTTSHIDRIFGAIERRQVPSGEELSRRLSDADLDLTRRTVSVKLLHQTPARDLLLAYMAKAQAAFMHMMVGAQRSRSATDLLRASNAGSGPPDALERAGKLSEEATSSYAAMRAPLGEIVTMRDQLIQLWGKDASVDPRTLAPFIAK